MSRAVNWNKFWFFFSFPPRGRSLTIILLDFVCECVCLSRTPIEDESSRSQMWSTRNHFDLIFICSDSSVTAATDWRELMTDGKRFLVALSSKLIVFLHSKLRRDWFEATNASKARLISLHSILQCVSDKRAEKTLLKRSRRLHGWYIECVLYSLMSGDYWQQIMATRCYLWYKVVGRSFCQSHISRHIFLFTNSLIVPFAFHSNFHRATLAVLCLNSVLKGKFTTYLRCEKWTRRQH